MTTTESGTMPSVNVSPEAFHDVGYVVLPELLSAEEAHELADLFPELGSHSSPVQIPGASSGRIQANERSLLAHEPFRRVLYKQELIDAVNVIFGDDWYLLAYESIEVPPGMGRERDWHTDFHFPSADTIVANAGIYLQDMTMDRGPLYLVPASHQRGREPTESEINKPVPGEIALTVPAGSAAIFHGRLWHTASQNRSSLPRRAIFAYFGHRWLRRMDDYYLRPLPDEILSSDDPYTKRLFGLDGEGSLIHASTYTADNQDWQ